MVKHVLWLSERRFSQTIEFARLRNCKSVLLDHRLHLYIAIRNG